MPRKRYESPWFTAGLFAIIFLGLIVTGVDPFGLAASNGGTINAGSLSATDLVFFGIGLAMIVAGFAIRLVAISTLKKNFSGALRIREGHTLVTYGIYKYVRHPAYLGAIVLFAGIPVMFSSFLGLLVMLLLIPYLVHRIKLEEGMMIERFGKEYQDYMLTSKRLIPFVY
ncbi:MAG TPA: isoprenylcysteine carboxylmethyltransferase family protein [Methanomassiliicoccales archaeon]|nr:isoprenylcysteine carboxylmethyltransferase family protein [Methanomassiliicoccales archaeon]